MTSLNSAGASYARSLISAGSVNKTGSWSFAADDGNKLLGPDGDDWSNYGKHFLGIDTSATKNTKAYWKYPFAKGSTLFRSGIVAIRDRAGQQKDTDISDAAGKLLAAIDKGKAAGNIERKALSFEIKDISADDGTFSGYGSTFGNLDSGGDVVQQGAFAESLNAWRAKGKMPKMLWQHDTRQPIGVWTNMQEDQKGLLVSGRFTKGVQAADEAYALLKDGAIDGLSIGYCTLMDSYDTQNDVRTLVKVDLLEVSLVTIPMNAAAGVTAVKAFTEAIDAFETLSDAERLLREAGREFSRKEATDFVSKVKAIAQREAGDDHDGFDPVEALNRLAQKMRA